MIRLTIDRFEGDRKAVAVLLADDGTPIDFPRPLLPAGSKPGDVLAFAITRDEAATEGVARATRRAQDHLARGDDGGDIKL